MCGDAAPRDQACAHDVGHHARAYQQHGQGRGRRIHRQSRNQRRRIPCRRAGQDPAIAAWLFARDQLSDPRPISRSSARSRRRSRSPAGIVSGSVRSPRKSVPIAAPSPTRARASSTTPRRSSARKARRSRTAPCQSPKDLRPSPSPAQPFRARARRAAAVRGCRYSARRSTSMRRSSTMRRARHLVAASIARKGSARRGSRPAPTAAAAAAVGKLIAERAKAAGITDGRVRPRRLIFHGRVKALADAAREGGLSF